MYKGFILTSSGGRQSRLNNEFGYSHFTYDRQYPLYNICKEVFL